MKKKLKYLSKKMILMIQLSLIMKKKQKYCVKNFYNR